MFFDENTEESFYWAGFIAADGCVYDLKAKYGTYKKFQINLSAKDVDHLEKLGKYINSNVRRFSSPKGDKIHYKCGLQKQNADLIRSLDRFNIVCRKSFNYIFPEFIKDHELCNHFIRGYLDGDGCWHKNKVGQHELTVCGTEPFLNSLKEIFDNIIGRETKNKPSLHNGQYRLIYAGNVQCFNLAKFIYNNSSVFLERKKEITDGIVIRRNHG